MKIDSRSSFLFLVILLFQVFSCQVSLAKKLVRKDTLLIDNFVLTIKIGNHGTLLPIEVKLCDTITGVITINEINDLSAIISEELYDFNVYVINNQFILEYKEVFMGHSYFTHYHVFERCNDNFFYTKEYLSTSDRNESTFTGSLNLSKVSFESYKPIELNGSETVTISSFYGYQEGKESKPFLIGYENKVARFCENKQLDSLDTYCDFFVLDYFLSDLYSISLNQTGINNIAYYLEKSELYDESIYILNNLINHFPNRTVAYINLGDAYWGLKENYKAKEAYQKYMELMKASGRESKIPKRVFERIK
jgi:tetratricopeptide (TPR) repeat protein